jgi:Mce-associated membrane protein
MNADDDPPTDPLDPTDSVDQVDRVATARPRPRPSKPTLAAATLSALRAGARSAPSPVDGAGPEPAAEVAAEPAPANDADDADANDGADPETDADDDTGTDEVVSAGPVRSRPSVLTGVCTIVAVAALIFASVAGVLWWRADHGTARKIGVAREQVDVDARLAIVTVNSSDYRHPSDALANWLDVSTGLLHSQFSQSRTTVVHVLAEAKMVTKATVLDAAVTALDLTKGTASVIASVNVTRTPATGAVSTVRNRFRASMTRTGGEWKLSNLTVVPVSLS